MFSCTSVHVLPKCLTAMVIDTVKCCYSNLWARCDLHVVGLQGMMSYFAKLTGEDLSRYLNKTASAGFRKACY